MIPSTLSCWWNISLINDSVNGVSIIDFNGTSNWEKQTQCMYRIKIDQMSIVNLFWYLLYLIRFVVPNQKHQDPYHTKKNNDSLLQRLSLYLFTSGLVMVEWDSMLFLFLFVSFFAWKVFSFFFFFFSSLSSSCVAVEWRPAMLNWLFLPTCFIRDKSRAKRKTEEELFKFFLPPLLLVLRRRTYYHQIVKGPLFFFEKKKTIHAHTP